MVHPVPVSLFFISLDNNVWVNDHKGESYMCQERNLAWRCLEYYRKQWSSLSVVWKSPFPTEGFSPLFFLPSLLLPLFLPFLLSLLLSHPSSPVLTDCDKLRNFVSPRTPSKMPHFTPGPETMVIANLGSKPLKPWGKINSYSFQLMFSGFLSQQCKAG